MAQVQLPAEYSGILKRISSIIEQKRTNAKVALNNEQLMMSWEIGRLLVEDVIEKEKPEYDKEIIEKIRAQSHFLWDFTFLT